MLAFPVPEDGETTHQGWLLEIVQLQVEESANIVEPPIAVALLAVGETVSEQAACVTVTLTGSNPGMVTVIVATLGLQVVLA